MELKQGIAAETDAAGAATSAFPIHNPTHNRCILVRLLRRLAVPASL